MQRGASRKSRACWAASKSPTPPASTLPKCSVENSRQVGLCPIRRLLEPPGYACRQLRRLHRPVAGIADHTEREIEIFRRRVDRTQFSKTCACRRVARRGTRVCGSRGRTSAAHQVHADAAAQLDKQIQPGVLGCGDAGGRAQERMGAWLAMVCIIFNRYRASSASLQDVLAGCLPVTC